MLPYELLVAHKLVTAEMTAHGPASFTLGWGGEPGTLMPTSLPRPQGHAQDPRVLPSCTRPPFPDSLPGVPGA